MNDDDLYAKTDAGYEALRTRSATLPPRLRSILIMIDGVRRVRELRAAAATIGAPDDAIDTLAAMGFVAAVRAAAGAVEATPVDPTTVAIERFRLAKKYMNDTVVDALGIRAFMFTLRLEKCAVLADLAPLVPEYTRLLTKARGVEVAGALETRLRELLR
ncbi:MAG: hypothetical protein AMXMBFR66_23230 [Pseudomonadota bacterium]|nr:hypothetical protein [Rubrivivax sp.]NLZ40805.1 hypothetical protein [Comamonadaceae bacterium]